MSCLLRTCYFVRNAGKEAVNCIMVSLYKCMGLLKSVLEEAKLLQLQETADKILIMQNIFLRDTASNYFGFHRVHCKWQYVLREAKVIFLHATVAELA